MDFKFFLLIFFALLNLEINGSSADSQDISDQDKVVQFSVLKSKSILIPNRNIQKKQQLQKQLKFSLNGATIQQVEQSSPTSWKLKLSDGTHADLYAQDRINVTEYEFSWKLGSETSKKQEICFHYGYGGASWYNAYQSFLAKFPMDTAKTSSFEQFGFLHEMQRHPSKEFSLILEYLYLNSDGFAILLDQYNPWFIRRSANKGDPLLCFTQKYTAPYAEDPKGEFPRLVKIRIFAGSDLRFTFEHIHTDRYGSLEKPVKAPESRLFGSPIWIAPGQDPKSEKSTQELVLEFTQKLIQNQFPKGDLFLDNNWHNFGDYSNFNQKQYPNADQLIEKLHDQGFRVGLGISGFLPRYNRATSEFFVKNNQSVQTENLDFSNLRTKKYFQVLLDKLNLEEKIDSFGGQFFDIPMGFKLNSSLVQRVPGLLTREYVDTIAKASPSGSSLTDMAFKTQHLPTFTHLQNYYRGMTIDSLLESVIPNALSVSLAGYSFLVPYTIAGSEYYSYNPTPEQYIRWIQACALMPRIALAHAPWEHYNQTVVDLAKKFLNLNAAHSEIFVELAKRRIQTGAPILRPMWYAAPNDPETYKIGDQFMLGEDILVAPVLKEGVRERGVYLPVGVWVDQHGVKLNGGTRVRVEVPLEELPYFVRVK